MDVLNPTIVKIGNRRYRKNGFVLAFQDNEPLAPYEEETTDMFVEQRSSGACKIRDEYDDESCALDRNKETCSNRIVNDEEEDYKDIEMNKNGMYQCVIPVSESYFGYLIGRNGEKKMNLERDTSTKIKIPQRKQGSDYVTIEGKDRSNVASCRNRIFILVSTVRHQKSFTHLLTFPLHFDNFKLKLNEFKERVVRECSQERGVDEIIFINQHKLHLTICTLTLISDSEIDQAVNLLEECRKTFIKDLTGSKPLKVRIKGLEYMNDDPSEVDVLYAKVEPISDEASSLENSAIQKISDALMQKFVASGLSKKQYDRVKLHATVMNSLMRTDPSGTSTATRKANNKLADRDRESFDARNILKLFGDFDFGTYIINEIHLSIRYSSGSDGFYDYVSKISFK